MATMNMESAPHHTKKNTKAENGQLDVLQARAFNYNGILM